MRLAAPTPSPSQRHYACGVERQIKLAVLAAAALCAWLPATALAAPPIPADLEARTVASGLQAPTAVAFAPDGRTFIAEKQGTVKVVLPGEAPRARLLLDISDHVATHVDRGLLGIAVDTDFASNGFLYLLYTHDPNPARTADPKVNRLTRVTVGAGATVNGSEKVLLGTSPLASCPNPGQTTDCLPSDGFSHSIGTVRADTDGTLWVGIGDGVTPGSTSPTIMRALDPNVMSGAILHIDRNGRGLRGHPFCRTVTDLTRPCTKVFSKGFRNPFRFSLLGDGRVAVGDVGYEAWEEVNLIEGGRSYGWPCREGRHPTPGYSTTPACKAVSAASQTDPWLEYPHTSVGGAVMAGPLLGPAWPAGRRGMLALGDYALGTLSLVDPAAPLLGRATLLDGLGAVVDVTAAPGGGVALVEAGFTASGLEPGRVWVVEPAGASQRPWLKPTSSSSGLTVAFDAHAQDADTAAGDLEWSWDFGDGQTSAEPSPTHSYAAAGVYPVTVTVSDGTESATESFTVTAGLDAPVVTISSPPAGTRAVGGRLISLSGSATVDGKPLRPSALMWTVLLHHREHQHYLTGFSGAVGSFEVPADHDADSWYDVKLKAITGEGRTGTARLRIDPKTRSLDLRTSPAGIGIGWGGTSAVGPRTSAVGFRSTLSVPSAATVAGKSYRFSRWSDGSRSASRSFTVPDRDTTLTAIYARG